MGLLEVREPKSVTAGIRWRGRWDIIRFRGNEWEFEVQVIKDVVVDSGELVKLELCSLGMEPFKEGNLIVVEVRSLKNVKVPLVLLCMHQQVIDVAGNGGLA